jgi:hypothetical protein
MLTKDTRVKLDDVGITEHVSPDNPMKDRAVFYLDRRLRALEEVAVKHEGLAEAGVPYDARCQHQAAVDKKNEDNQHEREALQWLRDQAVEKL